MFLSTLQKYMLITMLQCIKDIHVHKGYTFLMALLMGIIGTLWKVSIFSLQLLILSSFLHAAKNTCQVPNMCLSGTLPM